MNGKSGFFASHCHLDTIKSLSLLGCFELGKRCKRRTARPAAALRHIGAKAARLSLDTAFCPEMIYEATHNAGHICQSRSLGQQIANHSKFAGRRAAKLFCCCCPLQRGSSFHRKQEKRAPWSFVRSSSRACLSATTGASLTTSSAPYTLL